MAKFFNFDEEYFGLTESEIEKKLSMYGLNTYTRTPRAVMGFSYAEIFLSPSVLLMFIAGVLSFFGSGVGMGIVVLLIDAIYVCMEIHFRKTSDDRLDEIEETTSTKFRVIRSGKPELIEKELIVPEDTIVVQAGERVPADAFILEARDLTVDEGVFTGSRTPVAKYVGAMSKSDLKPTFVYSGTTVITGMAVCKVSATGVDTRYFQKFGEASDRHPYYTDLEKVVRSIVPMCSAVALVLTIISMLVKVLAGSEIIPSALGGITLGLCFIPTGIGAVIRMYYTRGAMSLIKGGAVVKSLSDIEKLNSLSVLCVEKEGAISKNSLEARGVYAKSEELLYKVAALACDPNTIDPAERALMVKATFFDDKIADVYTENEFIEKISEGESITGAVWSVGGTKICCIKGIPEQILPMCRLSGDELFSAQKKYEDYYAKGCSVMAVACVDANSEGMDVTAGFSYTFVGFVAFSAPLRDSVSSAVKTCRRSGVRVVMLTEENPSVAESTGKMIGLSASSVITGKQIEESAEYGTQLDFDADIYAKLTPEQKLYVIGRLKENGEVVAMTGTRTGDAEALEAADVGITISQHSAGCTIEAADVIMNDDNFSTIADMIAAARQIHRNIKRAVSLMISGYAGLMVIMMINLFTAAPLVLTPAMIALVTMIFLPVAALEYMDGRADMRSVMPPSEFVAERKLNYRFIGGAALFGFLSGAVAIVSYLLMYNGNIENARSCALIAYSFCSAAFAVLRHSDEEPFRAFIRTGTAAKVAVAVFALAPIVLVYVPFINSAFGLAEVNVLALLISAATGILPAAAYYFAKHFIGFKELS
ncbi:MAG: HAD family hydrolase [Lachnospiraceae bacterium]|nr:HAD family hydrolase [Ruminococcus sp.]MCM1275879.1 HAD family hydrolase [Lachnospiraceae bacterium]